MATKADIFANVACITVAESAANTLTFVKLETGISLMEKVAWIIHRIEYYNASARATQFVQVSDELLFGVSVANTLATMAATTPFTDPNLIDWNRETFYFAAAAAGTFGVRILDPYIKDFTSLPSGGLIVPPTPLYGWVQGVGLAAANTVVMKMFYTTMELSTDQYWQLVEARRVLSA